jgi:hypothetical protein
LREWSDIDLLILNHTFSRYEPVQIFDQHSIRMYNFSLAHFTLEKINDEYRRR